MKKTLYLLMIIALIIVTAFLNAESQIKLACIGDSITAGYGLSNAGTDGYPAQLEKMLGSKYIVNNYGVSGATLMKSGNKPYKETSAYSKSLNWLPDIVIIMLGSNDAKSANWSNKSKYIPDYLDLIESYRNLSSKPKIYIASCAKVYGKDGSGRFGITDSVVSGEILPLIKQIVSQTNLTLIDINKATSGMSQNFPDYVHPNKEGCTVIAKAVYDVVKSSKPITQILGDVNADNEVTIVDALLIAKYYVNPNLTIDKKAGDVNCDNTVNIVDALLIAQYYVGLISKFKC